MTRGTAFWIEGAIILSAVGLRLLATYHRMRRERDEARLALALHLAKMHGEAQVERLLRAWEQRVIDEGLEFADGDEAAYAFADFLANQTGQTIVAQQLNGDGVVIAIPDEEPPSARP